MTRGPGTRLSSERFGIAGDNIGSLLAIVLSIAILCVALRILYHDRRFPDFREYYRAGQTILLHQSGNLYWQALPDGGIAAPTGFIYPPFGALVFTVFARLPYSLASTIWLLASVLGSATTLVFGYGTSLRRGGVILALLLVGFLPLWWSLLFGQVTLLLFTFGAATWFMGHRPTTKPWLAALPLGLTLAVKPLLITLPLFLWASGRKAAAVWSVVWAAVGSLIGVLLVGPDATRQFVTQVLPFATRPDMRQPSEQSLAVLFVRLAGPTVGRDWAIAAFLVIAAVTAAVIARRRATVPEALALALAAALLAGPRTWDHYVVLLLPTFVLLWTNSRKAAVIVYALTAIELSAFTAGVTFPFDLIATAIAWLWLLTVSWQGSPVIVGESAQSAARPRPALRPGTW